MMNSASTAPKVFISYSWTSEEHQDWVVNLATRLMENGVDVILDVWALKEGQDVYDFMETMVRSDDVDRVLVICDKGYKEKSDNREGGVGTETQIISPEVYRNVQQEKFIPIIAERGVSVFDYIPTFMQSRKYIDLSSPETFEENFELLLRNLFGRPLHRKPALGMPPSWLFEDAPNHYKTSNINKQIRDAIQRNPARLRVLIGDFKEALFELLEQFNIEQITDPLDEVIANKINDMLLLRNDYVEFVELISSYQEEVDTDIFITFFEELHNFTCPNEDDWHQMQRDHFKFFVLELFLYTVTIFLHYSQFKAVSVLTRSPYFIRQRFGDGQTPCTMNIFNRYVRSLDEIRNNRLGLRKISLTADIMVQRATLRKYQRNKLVESDLLMYYLSVIHQQQPWFPRLYIYGIGNKIPVLQRLISTRHFERVRILFDVETPGELKTKILEFDNSNLRGYHNSFETIPHIRYHIDPDKICTLP
jgi:hypothetical protein